MKLNITVIQAQHIFMWFPVISLPLFVVLYPVKKQKNWFLGQNEFHKFHALCVICPRYQNTKQKEKLFILEKYDFDIF